MSLSSKVSTLYQGGVAAIVAAGAAAAAPNARKEANVADASTAAIRDRADGASSPEIEVVHAGHPMPDRS